MNENINNRVAFNLYVLIYFCLTIFVLGFFVIFLIENISGNKIYDHHAIKFVIIGPLIWICFELFDRFMKPSYFEANINFGQICIKSFTPNTRNGFRFFLMLFYRQHLIEHIIERQSYNNYRITIERLGFKKTLVLQKTENGKLYESTPINISYLGAKKYTALILLIDRLKEKISLN